MLALLALSLLVSPLAVAAPTDVELDGDPNDSPAGAPHDWDVINAGGSAAIRVTGLATEVGDVSIFTNAGGNRDNQPISAWTWVDGPVADKDDLLHAMAAEFSGDRFYFAADRGSNNGDGYLGVWLLEDDITTVGDGTFAGAHGPNDVLIVVTWGPSGILSTLAYQWVGGVDGIQLLAPPASALEAATNSGGGVGSPWTYAGNQSCPVPGGSAGCLPLATFVEGGVDLMELGVSGCYRTVIIESRSSQASTAQLKDFLILPLNPPCEPVAVEPSTWGAIKRMYR
jgi:hypothetical protein